jgi:hypothetical protein
MAAGAGPSTGGISHRRMGKVSIVREEPAAGTRSMFPPIGTHVDKGPTEGNHRLTALTGSLLAPLLGLVFLTGLLMDALWHIHYAVGFVLIPVVVLKLGSTGYRVVRYYSGDLIYRTAGPPAMLSRLLAPLMVVSVVVALGTGVALFVQHTRGGTLSALHTDAALSSAFLVGIHILTYALDALATLGRELRARFSRPASLRMVAALAALALGIVIALVTYSSGTWPARPYDRQDGTGRSSYWRHGVTQSVLGNAKAARRVARTANA